MALPDWSAIRALTPAPLPELFKQDANRVATLSADVAGVHFDWSKTHLTADAVSAFAALAETMGLAEKRDALFAGESVNVTEGRAAEHSAERGEGAPESVAVARAYRTRMRAVIDAIEAEAFGPVRSILHVGIGGSALGPDLLVDALGRDMDRYEVAIVSNVDGVALEDAIDRFDPKTTLLAIASKTFTTTETMLNAESALAWMQEGGVEDPHGQVIALTAAPEKALEWGVDETASCLSPKASAGVIRSGRRSASPRRWLWAGTHSRNCSKARPRWTAISASRSSSGTLPPSLPLPTFITPRRAAARRGRLSPMTNGCVCCLPTSSSSRWNRTARA